MNIKYPAIVSEQEEGGYIVSFPDMDEAFTEGDTLDEAIYNAVDVLTLTLESRVDEGMPVPEPSTIDSAVYSMRVANPRLSPQAEKLFSHDILY
jgi:antitoxin HicB